MYLLSYMQTILNKYINNALKNFNFYRFYISRFLSCRDSTVLQYYVCVCVCVCVYARVAPVAGGPGSGPMACGPCDGGGGDGVPSVWFASGP